MFEHNRVFTNRDSVSGYMHWYFETREGVMGPYDTKGAALDALEKHIIFAKQHRLDGGRAIGVEDGVQKAGLQLLKNP